MEVEGRKVAEGTCKHCELKIEKIEWGGQPGVWSHADPIEGVLQEHCPGQYKAEPIEEGA